MGEDTQYVMAMTKPLPYGCIKKQGTVTYSTKFNKILDTISHDDKIGHFFIVDIKVHDINEKRYYLTKFTLQFLRKIKKLIHMKDLHFSFLVLSLGMKKKINQIVFLTTPKLIQHFKKKKLFSSMLKTFIF